MIFKKSILTIYSCLALLLVNSCASYSMEEIDLNDTMDEEIYTISNNPGNIDYKQNMERVLHEEILKIVQLEGELKETFVPYEGCMWFKELLNLIAGVKKLMYTPDRTSPDYDQIEIEKCNVPGAYFSGNTFSILSKYISQLSVFPLKLYRCGTVLNDKQITLLKNLLQSFEKIATASLKDINIESITDIGIDGNRYNIHR